MKKNFDTKIIFQIINNKKNENYELILDTIIDKSRWSILHSLIFKDCVANEYWATYYHEDKVDGSVFISNRFDVECIKMNPVEKIIINYEVAND